MQNRKHNNAILNLLLSSRYRIVRHFILFLFILFITSGFVVFMEEEGALTTPFVVLCTLLFFIIIFLGGCYLNIYVLVPRFLLKNKWLLYFSGLSATVVLIMFSIIFIQVIFPEKHGTETDTNYMIVIINLLSSSLSIFLLFVGTSTFVLFKHWIQDMQTAEEIQASTMQIELKLLENQINPHFLFNMLNNANIMIRKDADTAVHIIQKLEDMLHYQINEYGHDKVFLKKEISFLNDFLELEKTRRDNFTYIIRVEGEIDNIKLPPLLFITFVENAVKHNLDSEESSYVDILFENRDNKLFFVCENSIPKSRTSPEPGGIGLANIKRRLDLLYNDNYRLEHKKNNSNYIVKLELNL